MPNPLDSDGKTIRPGDEIRYKFSTFTVTDMYSDTIIVAANDKGKEYPLKAELTTRTCRPLHVSRNM